MRRVFGSFRDPSGSVYDEGERIVRSVSESYAPHYRRLVDGGLRDALVERGQLIPFSEDEAPRIDGVWKTLAVERVPFISYPYEWCFSQLRDAALLTLDIQIESLKRGMILKDASAFNVAFRGGGPVLIDCLSFETWNEGQPWQGYRQFCSHFLAPLLLMSKVDARLGQLLRVHLDGVPLDLASGLLPRRTFGALLPLLHIHAHARAQNRFDGKPVSASKAAAVRMSQRHLIGLAEQLSRGIAKLAPPGGRTTWGNYYAECNYSDAASAEKLAGVTRLAADIKPTSVLDLGANDGHYSRALAGSVGFVISADFDHEAVERNHRANRRQDIRNVYPVLLDLANPSGGLGWAGRERSGFQDRAGSDIVLALALVHHLVITLNIPLPMIADEFARLGRHALVEFVPPGDRQVQRISAMRPQSLDRYSMGEFQAAFGTRFEQVREIPLPASGRSLHLFRRR